MSKQVYIVREKQSLIDIAIQLYGSYQGVFLLMEDNGITEVSFEPAIGTELLYESETPRLNDVNERITDHFEKESQIVISDTTTPIDMPDYEFEEGEEDEPRDDEDPPVDPEAYEADMILELQDANGNVIPNNAIVVEGVAYKLVLRITNTGDIAINDTASIPLPVETKVDGGDGSVIAGALKYEVQLTKGQTVEFETDIHFEANSQSDVINHQAIMGVANSNEISHIVAGTAGNDEISIVKTQFDNNGQQLSDPAFVAAEDVIEYVLEISRQNGSGVLSGYDELDENLEWVANGVQFGHPNTNWDPVLRRVNYSIDVDEAQPEKLSFMVKVAQGTADGTNIPNIATIQYANQEYQSNIALLIVGDEPADPLKFQMTKDVLSGNGDPAPTRGFIRNQLVRFPFTIQNISGANITDAVLDQLPQGLTFFSATQDGSSGGTGNAQLVSSSVDGNGLVSLNVNIDDGHGITGYILALIAEDADFGVKFNNYTYQDDTSNIVAFLVRDVDDVQQVKNLVDLTTGSIIPAAQPVVRGAEYGFLVTLYNTEPKPRNVSFSDVILENEYDFSGVFAQAPSWATGAIVDVSYDSGTRTVSKDLVIDEVFGSTPTNKQVLFKVTVAGAEGSTVTNQSTGTEN